MKKGIAYLLPNNAKYKEMIDYDYRFLCAFKNGYVTTNS